MPRYMTQFSYTSEAWGSLVAHPEDRKKAVSALMRKAGGRLIDIYYTLGDFDGFLLYEAPDDESAAAAVVAAVAPGHLSAVKTTKLFTMEETLQILRRAGELSYQAPKGS